MKFSLNCITCSRLASSSSSCLLPSSCFRYQFHQPVPSSPSSSRSTPLTFSQSCQLLPQHSIEKVSPMRTMCRMEKKNTKVKDRQTESGRARERRGCRKSNGKKSKMRRTRKIKNFRQKKRPEAAGSKNAS